MNLPKDQPCENPVCTEVSDKTPRDSRAWDCTIAIRPCGAVAVVRQRSIYLILEVGRPFPFMPLIFKALFWMNWWTQI